MSVDLLHGSSEEGSLRILRLNSEAVACLIEFAGCVSAHRSVLGRGGMVSVAKGAKTALVSERVSSTKNGYLSVTRWSTMNVRSE